MNTRLLLEWLKEYAADMRDRGRPWAAIDAIEHTRNIIEREEGEKA